MRCAGRKIPVVQVVRLHAHLDEAAHQRFERGDVVVHSFQQHRLAHHGDPAIDKTPAGIAGRIGQLARMIGVQRHVDRLR